MNYLLFELYEHTWRIIYNLNKQKPSKKLWMINIIILFLLAHIINLLKYELYKWRFENHHLWLASIKKHIWSRHFSSLSQKICKVPEKSTHTNIFRKVFLYPNFKNITSLSTPLDLLSSFCSQKQRNGLQKTKKKKKTLWQFRIPDLGQDLDYTIKSVSTKIAVKYCSCPRNIETKKRAQKMFQF